MPHDPLLTPIPDQMPARSGMAELSGARLAYWDTGGSGEAVILLHPGSGSHAVWPYQQPAFARAGYRVVGYSRRGHFGSDPGPADAPGTGAGDLRALADRLGIGRFHLLGLAAGGIVATDFALSHPDRLASLMLACTVFGIEDGAYLATSNGLRPKGFEAMPPEFREVGPSYRAANSEGVARWLALEHASAPARVHQKRLNRITLEALGTIRVPALLVTGDADLWQPPSLLRKVAAAIPGSEIAVIAECGHAAQWEQPEAFNRLALDHFARHRMAA